MKRFLLIFLGLGLGVILLLLGGMMIFFKKTEAPALQGDVSYSLPYHGEMTLDVYHPTERIYEKAPVLVYIHGGAWITGSKATVNNARFNQAFNRLRARGYAIVSPDYTLATYGRTPFPDCLIDAYAAMQWIESRADSLGIDVENVGLLGESAGGHLAQMLAFQEAPSFAARRPFPVRYLVDVYGPTDLNRLYLDQIPLIDSVKAMTATLPQRWQEHLDVTRYLFGFDPQRDSLRARQFAHTYSPLRYLQAEAPPTLLIHGEADRVVPFSQSELLSARLDSLQVWHQLRPLAGVDHAFRGATKVQKAQVQDWITDFVQAHYHEPAK